MLHAYVLAFVTSFVNANALAESTINGIITAIPNVELVTRLRWYNVRFSVTPGGISTTEREEFLLQQLAAAMCVLPETTSETIPKCISASRRGRNDPKRYPLSLVILGLGSQAKPNSRTQINQALIL